MRFSQSLHRAVKLVGSTLGQSMDFAGKGFWKFMKYLVMGCLAIIASIAVVVAVAIGAGTLLGSSLEGTTAGVIGVFGISLLIGFAGTVYAIAAFLGGMEFIHTGKKVPYFSSRNVWASLKWMAFAFLAVGIFYALLFGAMFAMGKEVFQFFSLFLNIAILPISVALGTFMYYVYPEIAVNKRGPIDAIMTSFRIAKKNFWETLVIFLLMYTLSSVVFGILYVVGMVSGMFILLAAIGAQLDATGWLVLGVGIFIAILVFFAVYLLVLAASSIVNMKFYENVLAKKKK